jgi:hypothetical protein
MDNETELEHVIQAVRTEVQPAVTKHGEQHGLRNADWLAVVTEELGESAHHISEHILGNDTSYAAFDVELVQTAAMVVRWIVERRANEIFP